MGTTGVFSQKYETPWEANNSLCGLVQFVRLSALSATESVSSLFSESVPSFRRG